MSDALNRQHLFLIGPKGVGKSTLIRRTVRVLQATNASIGGFFTVRTDALQPGRFAVHMLRAGKEDAPSGENLLFFCRDDVEDPSSRFNLLGCAILAQSQHVDCIVMDELGPHEAYADAFWQAVMETLDGDIPVIGVLQACESAFLADTAAHPSVCVLDVTEENRDVLFDVIQENWLPCKGVEHGR